MKIYHSQHTRGFRIIWLCEELCIPYQVVTVDFSKAKRFSEDFLKISPLGKLPVLKLEDGLIYESSAMMQTILDAAPENSLQPERGTFAYAKFLQWLWFSEATLMRPVGEVVNHKREFGKKNYIDAVISEMQGRVEKCLAVLNLELVSKEYILGGTFSAADISLGYTLDITKRVLKRDFETHLERYFKLITSRSAFSKSKSVEENV